jgi:hypothetical protein
LFVSINTILVKGTKDIAHYAESVSCLEGLPMLD